MKTLHRLLTISPVIAVPFGIGLIFRPDTSLSPYGFSSGSGASIVLELLGAQTIGLGVIAWKSRRAEMSDSFRAMLLGFLVADALAAGVSVHGVITRQFSNAGWLLVITYGVFAVGWAYYLWRYRVPPAVEARAEKSTLGENQRPERPC